MTLYADLQARIQESDAQEAIEILEDIWEQKVDMDKLTACLVEPASASLQLRFDTPHAMICLDSLLQLLNVIPSKDRLFLVQWYVRYLSGLPKLFLDFKQIERFGTLGVKQAKRGYVRSLLEHKVNNAFFYALRFIEEEGLEAFLKQCLDIASHEVDFLGHVFIYTHAVSRLCRLIEGKQAKTLIFQMTEFLSRRARIEGENLQKEGRELDSLVPMALEHINILGHNTILAHKISQIIDLMEDRYIENLLAQLVRNIENSSDRFSRDDLDDMLEGFSDDTKDPLGALRRSLTRGKERQSIYHCRLYLEEFGLTAELLSMVAKFLTAKNPAQPHAIIFPQAIFDLAQTVDQPYVEVAMARVILMVTGGE